MITWIQNQDLATGHALRKKQGRCGRLAGTNKAILPVQMGLPAYTKASSVLVTLLSHPKFFGSLCGSCKELFSSALLSVTSFLLL